MVLSKNDHVEITNFLRTNSPDLKYDRLRAEKLLGELNAAQVLSNSEVPNDVVGLNSRVRIRNTVIRQNQEFVLVLPDRVDRRFDRLSVLDPLGSALLGHRKGDTVTLLTARGKRYYAILESIRLTE